MDGEWDRRSKMAHIVSVVAEYYKISVSAIRGPSRVKHIVQVRHTAYYLCRTVVGSSYPEIGRFFGRDHTTILYAVRKFEADSHRHTGRRGLVEQLRETIARKHECREERERIVDAFAGVVIDWADA
jgi:chromosomal replication initiator protein